MRISVRCSVFGTAVLAAFLAILGLGTPAATGRDDASAAPMRIGYEGARVGVRLPDATAFGAWYSLHDGFGRTAVASAGRRRVLTMTTRSPATRDQTFSTLVHTRRPFRDVDFSVSVRTVEQLRRPAPNPWEVGWILWRYTDNKHFYSFIVKPDGWELAKQDAAYRGSQRFLAYSYARRFPIGRRYRIRVRHVGNTITVWVDGSRIVQYTDRARPYRSGAIALYAEDSSVRYTAVYVRRGR